MLILLDEQQISSQLNAQKFNSLYKLHLLSSVDSTNRYLKDLPMSSHVDICCAETQTQGKGRFGRQWHSPFAENIYCSSRWTLGDLTQLSGLSLITSLAVLATVKAIYPDPNLKLKWPNDLLWGNKKLSGSL